MPDPVPPYPLPPKYPEPLEPSSFPELSGSSDRDSAHPPAPSATRVDSDHSNIQVADPCNVSRTILSCIPDSEDEILSLLFEQGTPVDYVTCNGNTPLFLAVQAGNLRLVKFLLSQGASPSAWSSGHDENYSRFHFHEYRDFFLPIVAENLDICKELRRFQFEHDRKHSRFSHARNPGSVLLDDLYAARTPAMEAARTGRLAILKLLVEGHGANPNAVAPDGQTALRLASKNGHRDVVNYLPSNKLGAWRRIKFHSRKSIRHIKRYADNILEYTLIVFYCIPKFLLWEVPKDVAKSLYKTITNPENLKVLAQWLRGIPRFLFRDIPLFLFRDLPHFLFRVLPPKLFHFGKWLLKVVSKLVMVQLPSVVKAAGVAIYHVSKVVGKKITQLAQATLSTLHTVIMAVVTFCRAVTIQDVWNGLKDMGRVLFMSLPKAVWKALKISYHGIERWLRSFLEFVWLLSRRLVQVVLFVPKYVLLMLVEIGKLLKKVGHELLLCINPKW